MKKNIFSLLTAFLVAFAMVFSSIPMVYAETAETAESETLVEITVPAEYSDALALLSIVDPSFPLSQGETTTRAEFVAAIAGILNVSDSVAVDAPYADVTLEHPYVNDIAFAKGMGLISDAENFNPDDAVTYTQALKILVCAAGYGEKAEYTGGYPLGYLKLANSLDITKGVDLNNDSVLTHYDSVLLIFNTVQTDVAEQTSFGAEIEYTATKGKDILNIYYDIKRAEGVVDANAFSGLRNISKGAGEATIAIGKDTFFGEGYDDLLGKNSKIFYRNDSKHSIVYAYAFENNEYSYTSEDGFKLSGLTLTVDAKDSDKEKKYKLNGEYSVIYNGKYLASTDYAKDLKAVKSGTITLVDYDGSDIDVIIIKDIEYGVIGNINIIDAVIYDADKRGGMLDLGEADYYNIREADGTALTIRDLKAKDTIGIAKSKDSKKIEIIRYKNILGKMFDAKTSDGKLSAEGEEYVLSDYCESSIMKYTDIKLNTDYMIYLGEGNAIITIEKFESGINYGYIVATAVEDGTSLSSKNEVRLFGSNGKMNVYPLADNIKLNGKSESEKDVMTVLEGIANKFAASTSAYDYLWRVVKYSVNSKNELTSIWTTEDKKVLGRDDGSYTYTPEELAEQMRLVYDNKVTADSRPRLLDDNTSHSYTSLKGKTSFKNGIFYPFFKAADDVTVLKVPAAMTTDTKWKDEKLYLSAALSDIQATVDADAAKANGYYFGYDVDIDGAHFVLWVSNEGNTASVSTEGSSAIVESVTMGINDNYEEVAIIRLYRSKSWLQLYCVPAAELSPTSSTYKALYGTDEERVKPGDIVNIGLNGDGEIGALERDFKFLDDKEYGIRPNNNSSLMYNANADDIPNYSSYTRAYRSGYIYSLSGTSAMMICYGDNSNRDEGAKKPTKDERLAAGDFGVVNMAPANLGVGTTVYVKFDRDRKSATVYTEADVSAIESYYTSGTNADFVVVRGRFNEVSMNIIYTN